MTTIPLAILPTQAPPYTDYFGWLSTATQSLLAVSDVFAQWGRIELAAVVVILVSIFGVKAALSHAPQATIVASAAELLAALAVTATILQFWTQPFPGVGMTIPSVIQVQADKFAEAITAKKVETLIKELEERQYGLKAPASGLDTPSLFAYFAYRAIMVIFEFAAFGVIVLSYVNLAVAVLLGPIFIPLAPTKHFSGLFNSWFRFVIYMAAMRVTAAATLFVLSQFVTAALSVISVWMVAAEASVVLGFIFAVLGASLYVIFKIPSMTAAMIGGSDTVGGLGGWLASTAGRAISIAAWL